MRFRVGDKVRVFGAVQTDKKNCPVFGGNVIAEVIDLSDRYDRPECQNVKLIFPKKPYDKDFQNEFYFRVTEGGLTTGWAHSRQLELV